MAEKMKRGLRWRWWQMWCALFLLPPATFSTLPVFSSTSLIHSPPFLPFELMCHFMQRLVFYFSPSHPLYMMCSRALDAASSVYISEAVQESFPSTSFLVLLFPPFPSCLYPFFSPSQIRCCHSLQSSFSLSLFFAQHFPLVHCQHCHSPEFSAFLSVHLQDFPLLRLDDIVDEQSNIVGFSMFNTTHPFYLEFIRSLNLSWREGCDLTYPGPAVSLLNIWFLMHANKFRDF